MIVNVFTGLSLLLGGGLIVYAQSPDNNPLEEVYDCPEGFYGRRNKRILPPEGELPYQLHTVNRDGEQSVNIPWEECWKMAMELNATDLVRFAPSPPPPPPPKMSNSPSSKKKRAPPPKKKQTPSPPLTPPAYPLSPADSAPPPEEEEAVFVPMCEGINWRLRFGAKLTSWNEPLPALGWCFCYQPGSMLAYLGNFKSDTISCMRERDPPPLDAPPPLSEY